MSGTPLKRGGEEFRARALRAALLVALLLGGALRLLLAFARPLWADEIYTLSLARRPFLTILEILKLDSGPPLHYLLARLLLLPFPGPGPADVLVRLLSVTASLLHFPLLVRIGRRAGAGNAGAVAAGLFALFPLAVSYGAEGRGYALASLLVLLAFDRALALREKPSIPAALALGLAVAGALLTHYLALLPLLGLLGPLVMAGRRTRLAASGAAALAFLFVVPWLPVALHQPRASMAWMLAEPRPERAASVATELLLGFSLPIFWERVLAPVALALLAALVVLPRRAARIPSRGPLVAGLAGLLLLELVTGAVLLPERTALLFLPFLALLLAEAPPLAGAASALAALMALAFQLSGWLRPLPSEQLAATLAPLARSGERICAAGLWGPELDYRLARAGAPGAVLLFPHEVARHPGWLEEGLLDDAALRVEARAAISAPRPPRFWLLPSRSRLSAALLPELASRGATKVAAAGAFDLFALRKGPAPGRAGDGPP